MTIRELRNILTACNNQDLTIRELRAILFNIKNQDIQADEMIIKKITL